jgi:hypothetical protein
LQLMRAATVSAAFIPLARPLERGEAFEQHLQALGERRFDHMAQLLAPPAANPFHDPVFAHVIAVL